MPEHGEPAAAAPGRARVERWAYRAAGLAGAALAMVALGDSRGLPVAGLAALWWIAVLAVVRSDLRHFIIPDEASAAIGLLGLGASALETPMGDALLAALLRGAGGFGLFWLVGCAYRRVRRREGLGFGDVKLAGACAIWLPPVSAALALQVAALAAMGALLAGRRGRRLRDVPVPFGAFMAPAAWLAYVAGAALGLGPGDGP